MPRIIYKDSKGNSLKGVTTIIGEIWPYMKSKNLLDWACKLAMNYEKGIHLPIYHEWERDRAGRIGTLAHEYVTNLLHCAPETPRDHFDAKERFEAHRIYEIYAGWIKNNIKGDLINLLEHSMIDEENQYGGTPDFIGKLANGDTVILDWKTGYVDEISCLYQLSAYYNLCMVNHPDIDINYAQVVGLDRNKTKIKLIEYSLDEIKAGFDGFLYYLKAHHNRIKIEKMRKERRKK